MCIILPGDPEQQNCDEEVLFPHAISLSSLERYACRISRISFLTCIYFHSLRSTRLHPFMISFLTYLFISFYFYFHLGLGGCASFTVTLTTYFLYQQQVLSKLNLAIEYFPLRF